MLDQRYEMPLSLVEATQFNSMNLTDYTHVVLVSGTYKDIDKKARSHLIDWIRRGGVLVAMAGGLPWVENTLLKPDSEAGAASDEERESKQPVLVGHHFDYADYETLRGRHLVSGVILEAEIDRTHPIGFGYTDKVISVFRNTNHLLKVDKNPFLNVVRYGDRLLLSGHLSPEIQNRLRDSAVVRAERMGQGAVIRIVDNPNFRGCWYGTNKLFANALFFGGVIKKTEDPDTWIDPKR